MTTTLPLDRIFTEIKDNHGIRKLIYSDIFKAYIDTWFLLERNPDFSLEETPFYQVYARLERIRHEGEGWPMSSKEQRVENLQSRWIQYQKYRDEGYHPETNGIFPSVMIVNNTPVLCDGLTRLSMLYALGEKSVEFVVVKNCRDYYNPSFSSLDDSVLEELVEKAHSYQILYAPFRQVEKPMNLYLPINHPMLQKRVCSRFDSQIRLNLISKEMNIKKNRVLDVGSNTGFFIIELAKRFQIEKENYIGVDPKREYIEIARFVAQYNGYHWAIRFLPMKIGDFLTENEEKFDYVLFMGLFHHMLKDNEENAWYVLRELSKRGHTMFFETAMSVEPQMKHVSHREFTEETTPEIVLDNSLYTKSKKLSTGYLRNWSDRHKSPELPLRPLYKFWR